MATTTAYCSCAVECMHAVRLLRAINYELVELRIDSSLQSGSGSCLRVVFRALRNALELVETIFKARAEAVKDIELVFGFVESSILRIEFLTISWLAGRQEVAYNVWLQQPCYRSAQELVLEFHALGRFERGVLWSVIAAPIAIEIKLSQRVVLDSNGDQTGRRRLARVDDDPFTQLPFWLRAGRVYKKVAPNLAEGSTIVLGLHNRPGGASDTGVVELFEPFCPFARIVLVG